jgi:hypothetical protein
LQSQAERVFDELREPVRQDIARRVFVDLTGLAEGSEYTRRQVSRTDLLALAGGKPEAEQVLTYLIEARLITATRQMAEEQETGGGLVEICHEMLIRQWPRLRSWLDESREDLLIERRIVQATEEWEKKQRNRDLLWSARRIAVNSEWIKRHSEALPLTALAFLEASREQAARHRRLLVMGTALASVAVVAISWIAFGLKRDTDQLLEDSIVGDPQAKLMWTRTDNGRNVTWEGAHQYCEALTRANLSDWRLPTIEELDTLWHHPDIRKRFQLTGWWVWSSTRIDPASAWYLNIDDDGRSPGSVGYSHGRALCVRYSPEDKGH